MADEIKKFEVGKSYQCRSVCDSDCIFTFTILKRTENTVTLQDTATKEIYRRRPDVWDGQEVCFPIGYYSMCPIIRA